MIEDRPIYTPDQHASYQFDAPFFGTPERSFETKKPRKITSYHDAAVDVDRFLGWFYEFNDANLWPRKLIEVCYKRARMYVTQWAQCDQLDGDDREYARGLLVAHLCVLTKANQKQTSSDDGGASTGVSGLGGAGIITSASVGGVNVGMQLPNTGDAYEFWLYQTKYGLELLAFLQSHVPVGIYSEGDDLRSCLRD